MPNAISEEKMKSRFVFLKIIITLKSGSDPRYGTLASNRGTSSSSQV
jgi:hypothetical protein